jgi:hypothetical protein
VTGDGDPYDLDNLRLPPKAAGERAAGTPKRIRKRRQQFAKVPRTWVDTITRNRRDKTLAVVWHLLHEDWKQGGGRPIKMPNGMLAIDGVGRKAKWRVLDMLEGLGLITVERRGRKSPIITLNTNQERP